MTMARRWALSLVATLSSPAEEIALLTFTTSRSFAA
jgi:hypothetical protein